MKRETSPEPGESDNEKDGSDTEDEDNQVGEGDEQGTETARMIQQSVNRIVTTMTRMMRKRHPPNGTRRTTMKTMIRQKVQ